MLVNYAINPMQTGLIEISKIFSLNEKGRPVCHACALAFVKSFYISIPVDVNVYDNT